MKKRKSLLLVTLFILSFASGQDSEIDSLEQAAREQWIGNTAPGWSLKSEDGHYEFLQNWTAPKNKQLRKPSIQLERHLVVLIFYGSWCPPCVAQLDPLEEVYQKYKNKNMKFFIIDNTELARKKYRNSEWDGFRNAPLTKDLFKEGGITIPFLEEKNHGVFRKYEIEAIPTVFVIDQFQTIREIFRGFTKEEADEFKRDLSSEIHQLLED